jgi:hypothetical protein
MVVGMPQATWRRDAMFLRVPGVGELFTERFGRSLGWFLDRTGPSDWEITLGRRKVIISGYHKGMSRNWEIEYGRVQLILSGGAEGG